MIFLKVPGINGLGKTEGAEEGCRLICEGLEKGEVEELILDKGDVEKQEKEIYEKARNVLGRKEKILFVGGDHSISFSTGRAFFELNKNAKLIVFDAHADCMPPMKEATHEEWLRGLIEHGFIEGENVLIIGLRKVEDEERSFMNDQGIKEIKVEDVRYNSGKVMRWIRDFLEGGDVYVSFDIDALDPSIARATGYLEEEGLTLEESLRLLGKIFEEGNVLAGDLVEVHGDKGEENVRETVDVSRKILEKFKSLNE